MSERARNILVALVAIGFVVAVAVIAATPPETVVIDSGTGTKSGVSFNHKKHVDDLKIGCTVCHHQMKDASDLEKATKCVPCHNPDSKHQVAEGEAPTAKDAFHKSCTACHKKVKQEEQKETPTKCSACHPAA